MVGLQVCAPYILQILLDKLERRLQTGASLPIKLTGPQRERLLQWIPALRHAVTVLHRAHLSFFYIQGLFYHLSKRITDIHYVSLLTYFFSCLLFFLLFFFFFFVLDKQTFNTLIY